MVMHLRKWGNSLGLRVPVQYLQQLNLKESDPIEMFVDPGAKVLIIRRMPAGRQKKYNLNSLLSQIKEDQPIAEAWGNDSSKGNEIW